VKLADMDTCSLIDLRRNLPSWIARAKDGRRPLAITRRGTTVAVLMSIEQYELAFRSRDELASFVRAGATATLSRFDADESTPGVAEDAITARLDAVRCGFKGADVDEHDHRYYLG
jgi:prevent-host-death family protein